MTIKDCLIQWFKDENLPYEIRPYGPGLSQSAITCTCCELLRGLRLRYGLHIFLIKDTTIVNLTNDQAILEKYGFNIFSLDISDPWFFIKLKEYLEIEHQKWTMWPDVKRL